MALELIVFAYQGLLPASAGHLCEALVSSTSRRVKMRNAEDHACTVGRKTAAWWGCRDLICVNMADVVDESFAIALPHENDR